MERKLSSYTLMLLLLLINSHTLFTDVGEEGDITGEPINKLTTFQDIRNLSKGLFWGTFEITEKIEHLKKLDKPITVKPEEMVEHLEELQALLLTWDKLAFNFINQLLDADEDTRKEIKRQINNCTTMAAIERAFKKIPSDLPTIPVHMFAVNKAKDLFPEGKFDEATYKRKHDIYQKGLKKFSIEFRKSKDQIKNAFEESADDIMNLNKEENR
jgi:hypothetical protein